MSTAKKTNIAIALASQLHVAEEAIDTALAEAANLIETYVTSRRAIHMSPIIGNDVLHTPLQALLTLRTAQQHMTAAHADLTLVQAQVGLGNVAILPADDKPAPKPPTGHLVAPAEEEIIAAE
mgnify:CR=1 FL=1